MSNYHCKMAMSSFFWPLPYFFVFWPAYFAKRSGKVIKFEVNGRCAAGTGKFLEIMAHILWYSLDQSGLEGLKATNGMQISAGAPCLLNPRSLYWWPGERGPAGYSPGPAPFCGVPGGWHAEKGGGQ